MRYIALDLDKKTAFVRIFDTSSQTQAKGRIGLDPTSLMQFKNTLKSDDNLCMEACPGSFYLHDVLSVACKVSLINPILFGGLLRLYRNKTDDNDTGLMVTCQRADCVPTVWVPTAKVRDERAYSQHVMDLDEQRTRLRNRIHSLLVENGFGYEAEELLKMDAHRLLAHVRVRLCELTLHALSTNLKNLAIADEDLKEAQARVVVRAAAHPKTELITTLPGVDNVLSFVMQAVIDDVTRFDAAASLANYTGIVPSNHSSGYGNKPKHGPITKRGSALLRWAAIQAAQNARRTPGKFQNLYNRYRRRGMCFQEATVAVAHKLIEVLWCMLTRNEPYREVEPKAQSKKTRRREKALVKANATLSTAPNPLHAIFSNVTNLTEALKMAS